IRNRPLRTSAPDQGDLVGDTGGPGQKFGEGDSGLAGWRKSERRFQELAGLFVEMNFQLAGMILAIAFVQLRLGIEQIHLAWPAMLKEANDRFGARFEMGR